MNKFDEVNHNLLTNLYYFCTDLITGYWQFCYEGINNYLKIKDEDNLLHKSYC